jgi:hypothetical protein
MSRTAATRDQRSVTSEAYDCHWLLNGYLLGEAGQDLDRPTDSWNFPEGKFLCEADFFQASSILLT